MRAVELAIFNKNKPPIELLEYQYREKFGLSNSEMMNEPLEKFWLNLKIMSYLNEYQNKQIEMAQKKK